MQSELGMYYFPSWPNTFHLSTMHAGAQCKTTDLFILDHGAWEAGRNGCAGDPNRCTTTFLELKSYVHC